MNQKVSAILPTYNRIEFLKESIQSIINQTYDNWELIIVDDNSNDGTKEYCQQLILEDKLDRIKYIRLYENTGCVSIPRNIGLSYSTGEFICNIDDDVISLSNKFELLVNELNKDDEVLISYGDRINVYQILNNKEEYISCPNWNPLESWGVDNGQYMYKSKVYDLVEMNYVFPTHMCDWELAKKICEIFPLIGYINQPVCKYIWHSSNRSLDKEKRTKPIYPSKFLKYFNPIFKNTNLKDFTNDL